MRRFPDTLVLMLGLLLLAMVLTWLVPAGAYERTELAGRQVVQPGSFAYVEPAPQMPWKILTAPQRGFVAAAEIIAFVFLIGGSFAILNRTGAIHAGLLAVVGLARRHPRYRRAVIPLVMALFSLGGATFGMAEETLAFVLITIPLARSLGYDRVVGLSIPLVGSGVGFAGAFANPFTIGIAQGIAELPPFSGMGYRLLVWALFTATGIAFVMVYALRLERDPARSVLHGLGPEPALAGGMEDGEWPLDGRRKAVLALTAAALCALIVGATRMDWYIAEISALFLGLALLAALVYRLSVPDTVEAFYAGCRDMLVAAVIIGLARSLLVVAEDGGIVDTLLHGVVVAVGDLPNYLSVQVMFLLQSGLNLFVPSGSGQAALTMPVMAPLSDLLGVTRQTAVLAYQLGDGVSNLVIPTSGLLMGLLAIARIPYDRWLRFALPLVLLLTLLAMLLLIPPVTWMVWN